MSILKTVTSKLFLQTTLNSPKSNPEILWLTGGVVLVLLLVVGGFFLLREGSLDRSFVRYEHLHDHLEEERDEHDLRFALEEVERDLIEKPQDRVLQGKRAHLLLELNEDKAIGAYKELLKKDPKEPYVRLHLAQALAVKGRYDEAMAIGALLLREERSIETLELVGRIHYEQGNFSKSLPFAQEILKKDPSHQGAKLLEGYAKQGLSLQRGGSSR